MVDATGTATYSYDADGDVTSQALVAASGTGLANATTSYSYYTTGVLSTSPTRPTLDPPNRRSPTATTPPGPWPLK